MKSTVTSNASEATIRETETDPVVSGTQLTTYEDAEAREVVELEDNASLLWRASDSLPHQGMSEVLGRSYKVAEFVWSETDQAKTPLITLSFPQVLFSIPQIANKLEWFAYFRCKGVRLSVRINSTMFHYGAIGMSHVSGVGDPTIVDPILGVDYQTHARTFRQRMNNHVVILKAMTGETIEQNIPWEIPLQWLDIRKNSAYGRDAIIGKVWFDAMTPLFAVASAIQPVNVSVFANFIEPEVTAPLADTDVWPPPAPPSVVTQSSEEKEKTDLMTQVTNGVSSVITGVQKAVSMAAPIIETASMLLDKPGTIQAPTVAENRAGFGTYYGYGSSQYPRFSLHPDAKTDVDKSLSTVDLKPSIKQFISVPGYWNDFSFNDSVPVGTELAAYRVNPCGWFTEGSANYPSYLSYVSNLFRYWRGSIDYHFHFVTSKFVTARVRIAFKPGEVENTGGSQKYPADGPGGDIISKVIDVSGDTHVSLRIPFISDTLFKRCVSYQNNVDDTASLEVSTGGLTVTLVNEIASQEAGQQIFCFVWISGGPDMQFNHFAGQNRQWWIDIDPVTIPGAVVTQSAVRAFPEMVEPIVDSTGVEIVGIADSEQFDDYVSLGKRFSIEFPRTTEVTSCMPTLYESGKSIQSVTLQNYLSAPFRWIRGGSRVRAIFTPRSTSRSWELNGNNWQRYIESGSITTDTGMELPYYDKLPFLRVNSQPSYTTQTYYSGKIDTELGDVTSWWRAYSDDVGFSGLYSPPGIRTSEPVPPPALSALAQKKRRR